MVPDNEAVVMTITYSFFAPNGANHSISVPVQLDLGEEFLRRAATKALDISIEAAKETGAMRGN